MLRQARPLSTPIRKCRAILAGPSGTRQKVRCSPARPSQAATQVLSELNELIELTRLTKGPRFWAQEIVAK
jgi:hypothetical protein